MAVTMIAESIVHDSVTCYERQFMRLDANGNEWGGWFGFPCDKDGTIFPLEHEEARENLRKCLIGEANVRDAGIREWETRPWVEKAWWRCDCGEELQLPNFTNVCECGALYNSAGQELCDPSHWGEETGEHPADILRVR